MFKKLLILFSLFLLLSCNNDYISFHQSQFSFEKELQNLKEEQSKFSLKKIDPFQKIELHSTPDLDVLSKIIDKIDKAEKYIYIEVYILTEKRIQKALKNAHNRGVEIKVILEKNVYNAPYLNTKTFKNLSQSGISVIWANEKNFSLTHTKMMIIDEEAIIGTGNYSYSSFKTNREFFLFTKDKPIIKKLKELFIADFEKKEKIVYDDKLIISPFDSRFKITSLLENAKSEIFMYIQNISDKEILDILKKKKSEGVEIKIIIPSLKKIKSNIDEIEQLEGAGIPIVFQDNPYVHAKSILIDKQFLYIGSINFSFYSIEKNREIGFLIINKEIIEKFQNIFEKDYIKE